MQSHVNKLDDCFLSRELQNGLYYAVFSRMHWKGLGTHFYPNAQEIRYYLTSCVLKAMQVCPSAHKTVCKNLNEVIAFESPRDRHHRQRTEEIKGPPSPEVHGVAGSWRDKKEGLGDFSK